MTIADHDRRVLWARAHNSCAICHRSLVESATEVDRESIVGEEAHIVARSRRGPRGGLLPESDIDKYENLILLCRVDHRIVDDQPNKFTVDVLKTIKSEHESWAAERFAMPGSHSTPIRVVPHPDESPLERLPLLTSGERLWSVIANSHAYRLSSASESDGATAEQCDASDEFLDLVRDWGEISSEVEDRGMSAIRDVKRSLSDALVELARQGLFAFGGRRRLQLSGGEGPSSDWWEAIVIVCRADDAEIIQSGVEETVRDT